MKKKGLDIIVIDISPYRFMFGTKVVEHVVNITQYKLSDLVRFYWHIN